MQILIVIIIIVTLFIYAFIGLFNSNLIRRCTYRINTNAKLLQSIKQILEYRLENTFKLNDNCGKCSVRVKASDQQCFSYQRHGISEQVFSCLFNYTTIRSSDISGRV